MSMKWLICLQVKESIFLSERRKGDSAMGSDSSNYSPASSPDPASSSDPASSPGLASSPDRLETVISSPKSQEEAPGSPTVLASATPVVMTSFPPIKTT